MPQELEAPRLYCPPEWVALVEQAMKTALPAPRQAGPDNVRVALLVRQSKAREDESHGSPMAQLDDGLRLVQSPANHRWHLRPEHVFADIGVSGWAPGVVREGFDAMMSVVCANSLDVVVVWSLARLSRKGALDVLGIIDEFNKHGVRLVSITEPWLDTDPQNPAGQAIIGLTAALAQQESAQKSLHITSTLAEVRKRGGHVSGRPPYGLKTERVMVEGIKVSRLVPDTGTAESPLPGDHVLDMIRYRRVEELNDKEIADKLTAGKVISPTGKAVWIAQTVRKILRDPRLAGYSVEALTCIEEDSEGKRRRRPIASDHAIMYGPDGEPVDLHTGLISRQDWWDLQAFMRRDASKVRVRNPKDGEGGWTGLFTRLQLLTCFTCGRPMQRNPGTGRNPYPFYVCNSGPGGPKEAGKHSQGIVARSFEDRVAREAFTRLAALDPMDEHDAEVLMAVAHRFAHQRQSAADAAGLSAAKTELSHLQAALMNLEADRLSGVYDGPTVQKQYRASMKRLSDSEVRLLARIDQLEAQANAVVELPASWFGDGRAADPIGEGTSWAAWDLETRRAFMATVVERIDVHPVGRKGNHTVDRVKIHWVGEPINDEDE
ncbi:recombinase family protein [Kitasatospora sp. NPDC089797]|uniref:recombinase family protein n=1 Tax=Kitasatospora sp. NPDC089797 TaxID=3155298 RepID=UPI00341BCEE0